MTSPAATRNSHDQQPGRNDMDEHQREEYLSAREAPWSLRGSDRLYRVVQHYDSWPFGNDSRVRHGSKSHKRTDTFRTLGPVRQRLARANGHARYRRQHGGDWSGFVAMAEQLTDEGWQPIDVELAGMNDEQAAEPRGPEQMRPRTARKAERMMEP